MPRVHETPLLDTASSPGVTVRPLIRAMHATVATSELVAHECLEGLRRDVPVIVTPQSARAVWRAYRLAPRMADRIVVPLARRVLAQLPDEPVPLRP